MKNSGLLPEKVIERLRVYAEKIGAAEIFTQMLDAAKNTASSPTEAFYPLIKDSDPEKDAELLEILEMLTATDLQEAVLKEAIRAVGFEKAAIFKQLSRLVKERKDIPNDSLFYRPLTSGISKTDAEQKNPTNLILKVLAGECREFVCGTRKSFTNELIVGLVSCGQAEFIAEFLLGLEDERVINLYRQCLFNRGFCFGVAHSSDKHKHLRFLARLFLNYLPPNNESREVRGESHKTPNEADLIN